MKRLKNFLKAKF
jgi:preprotein translocase subunit SecF